MTDIEKHSFTMKDIGSIFGLGTTTTWQILKRQDDYRYIKKAYNKLLKAETKTNKKI